MREHSQETRAVEKGGGYVYFTLPDCRTVPVIVGRWLIDSGLLQPAGDDLFTVFRWLARHEEFRNQYARAQEDRASAMAEDIAKELNLHGVQEKNIWGANVSEWTDDSARRAWAAALNKDVDRTIVTKGVADTPLWTKTNWGRLIMQFKSFGLASHQRVLIAGLQERPHRLAEQMVFSTALGMMVGYLKFMERGDWEEAERLLKNPGLWVADGLDRTGIMPLAFEFSNTVEKLGSPLGIVKGVQWATGDEDQGGAASRYASRGKLAAVAGPWSGIFEDLTTIAQQLTERDKDTGERKGLRKSGANAIIRQLPGATLPIVRSAIHIGVKPEFHEALE